MEPIKCTRCGRLLTNEYSRKVKMGGGCRKKMKQLRIEEHLKRVYQMKLMFIDSDKE